MQVEVVYIAPNVEFIRTVDIQSGATVEHAIKTSGVLALYTDMSLERNRVGIYGKAVLPDKVLKEGDRVEIYQPLLMDPMEARRLRVRRRAGSD